VRVTNAGGEPVQAELTLAAVDEGIHALSGYQPRNPWDFFYASRALHVRWSDVYSKLMPEVDAPLAIGRSEAGGGSSAEARRRLLNPVSAERVRPVAIWRSGIVTDADGRAEVSLDLPRFDGRLRLVAIAASGRLFGMGEGGITVRKPVMVRASLPRVLAPGDVFEVPVTVFNHTGANGDATVSFAEQGGVEVVTNAEQIVALPDAADITVRYRLRAPDVPGVVKISFRAILGDDSDLEEVEIAVRPPHGLSYKSGCVAVDAGKTSRIRIPGDWLAGTEKFSLTCAPQPWLSLGAGLRYVMRYPYGCLEQTTSSVFPLLYLADVASALESDTLEREEVEVFVQAGIARIAAMQRSDGGFSMWMSGGRAWGWGSAYATHFLIEAKRAGYVVPARTLEKALSYMRRRCGRNGTDGADVESRAYACFVQALAGRADVAQTWRLFEDRKALTPTARFLIAGAMAHMGESADADGILQAASLPAADGAVSSGGSLHSSTREAALLLSIYMDRSPEHENVPLLVRRLTREMTDGCWRSTQENGYALLALGKYMRRMYRADTDYRATLRMPDGPSKSFTHEEVTRLELAKAGEVEVELSGTGRMFCFWTAEGVPLRGATPNVDAGLRVRRRFLSRDGRELDVGRIPHGEVVVVELTLAAERDLENVALVDLLPAGFEIENPRLNGRDGGLPDVGETLECDNVEMRDDRLLAFIGRLNGRGFGRPRVFRYVVRAVTVGDFAQSTVSAHCMYQPAVRSTHGAGRVKIVMSDE
jgi:alpha-2-macroglobulin